MLAYNINTLRKQKGITVDDLVLLSGVNKSTLSKITAGINDNPKLGTLKAICKALNCTLDDLDKDDITINHNKDNLTNKEYFLLENFNQLNEEGQEKIIDYIDDLVTSNKYKKSNSYGLGEGKEA